MSFFNDAQRDGLLTGRYIYGIFAVNAEDLWNLKMSGKIL